MDSTLLIPELPDDVARECLVRIPYDDFSAARSVSKLWKQEIGASSFHRLRKSSGSARTIVAVAQSESAPTSAHKQSSSPPAYRLALFEPATCSWRAIPAAPARPLGLPLFCQLAAVGRELVIVGGWDPRTWAPTDEVHVYDFVSGSWRRGAPMPGPRRSFFACAASEERRMVFVAGGHDEGKNALSSALAYDVAANAWAALPDMARPRDECRGVFARGSFLVVGGYATNALGQFERSSQAFDVGAWRWGAVEEGELPEGAWPRTCAAGAGGRTTYVCTPDGGVAEKDEGAWRAVADMPGGLRAALQTVAWEGGVMVLGSGMQCGAPVAYILELEGKRWKQVDLPPEYSGHVQAACCLEI